MGSGKSLGKSEEAHEGNSVHRSGLSFGTEKPAVSISNSPLCA